MPRYTYECELCDEVFDLIHSMSHKPSNKDGCEQKCVLKKIPSNLTILKSNKGSETNFKVGSVVKNSIEDFKGDLKKEKKRLKETLYEEDD